ncbi:histidine phosphatase family protein [Streptomyces sp. NPDC001070]
MAGRMILVRHGETDWNRGQRYYDGAQDPPLNATGEREAGLLRPYLAGHRCARVLCSPAARARRTAQLAGLRPDIDPELVEWGYRASRAEEDVHTADEGCEVLPCGHDLWNHALRSADCRGECLREVTDRADRVLARLAPDVEAGGDVLVVSHGNLIRLMATRWLGLPPAAAPRLTLSTASISLLGDWNGKRAMLSWNFAPAACAAPAAGSAG